MKRSKFIDGLVNNWVGVSIEESDIHEITNRVLLWAEKETRVEKQDPGTYAAHLVQQIEKKWGALWENK